MNMLIIKLGAIGDVIRTTSILPGLKEKYPKSKISWLTKKESFDILKNNSLIDVIFLIENPNNGLKKHEFGLVISLDDEDHACRIASEIKGKKLIGAFMENGKKSYTKDSSSWFDMGLISKFGKQNADELKARNKKTYQEIMYSILSLDYKKQEPILALNDKELEFGKKFAKKHNLDGYDIVIGINTGAGGRWHDKKLSIQETAELVDKLDHEIRNAKLLLFGGPEEKERNEKIKSIVKTKIIDAGCDNSLMEFASLVNLCDILITSDSLALHIGTALRKKVVVFFYPTSADEIELYGRGMKIIGKGKDYCSYKQKCDNQPEWDIGKIADAAKRLK